MKHSLLVACLATALFAATASAAGAVTVNGLTIDGQSYGMMLYGGQVGMQEGRVVFVGDRARVYLANGMFYSLRLSNNEIGDPNFIYATAPDGQTYRLQLRGSLPGYSPIQDSPIRPRPGPG
jgi:hypothetical protein